MYQSETSSWRADAKWSSALLLALAVVALVALVTSAQLSAQSRAVPILERVLQQSLRPGAAAQGEVAVLEELGYTPGDRLELLPGVGVFSSAEELEGLNVDDARARIAQELSNRILAEGAQEVAASLQGSPLEEPFGAAIEGSAYDLTAATLTSALLPLGLDNGSRMANWPLQAQQNPGEEVQPVVGVFVTFPPEELQGLSAGRIGELVISELARVLLFQGQSAADELVSNVTLSQGLSGAVDSVRERLQRLLQTLLLPFGELIGERIERARGAEEASRSGSVNEFAGVVDAEELSGLSREEADALVLERLAELAHEGGSAALQRALVDEEQSARAASVERMVDALSARAHARYTRLGWIVGGLALLFAVLLISLSRGWGSLANPGLALLLPAAVGALVASRVPRWFAAPSAGSASESPGLLDSVVGFFDAPLTSLPEAALTLLTRNYLIVLVVGAALLALSLLIRLVRTLRPRRRSLL